MSQIAYFNQLPPKAGWVKLVLSLLENQELSLYQLISKTDLTKTQVGCTLDMLVAKGTVIRVTNKGKNFYRKIDELPKDD